MESKNKRKLEILLYIVIFCVTSAPVFCGYVMDGGEAVMWLGRIQEIRNHLILGDFIWFPSAELIVEYSCQAQSFDSALWLLIPAGMQMLGIGEQMAWCLFMGLLSVISMLAVYFMMNVWSSDHEMCFWGVLFYMCNPYRIYIFFDRADVGQAIVWALWPLLTGGLLLVYQTHEKSLKGWIIAILAYGGIWYADARMGVVMGACLAVYLLLTKRLWQGLIVLISGMIIAFPSVIYLAGYMIKGGMESWNLPLNSIMGAGYSFGEYLMCWTYQPDHPGLGLGLLAAMLCLIWMLWMRETEDMPGLVRNVLIMSAVLVVLSSRWTIWDFVQRVGTPFLRFVGLLESPGIFWECAQYILMIPAAWTLKQTRKKDSLFLRCGLPIIIIFMSLATALYMCNTLTYLREPLGVEVVSTVNY